MIPRVFHYVWLGNRPMHPLMVSWRDKWVALHPSWKVKVWRDGPKPHHLACGDEVVECRYPDYLAACPTYAKRSDVWRYDILEQLGGVYLDTDMDPVRCIEPLLSYCTAFAGLCKTPCAGTTKLEVACSIMGAAAHHPWLRDIVQNIPSQDPDEKLSLAFPFLTHVTARHPEVRLFPTDVFFPFTWADYARRSQDQQVQLNDPVPECTYAIHRWSSLWFPWGQVVRTKPP